MEKVKVQMCNQIPGKAFWSVHLADGRDATVWAAEIAEAMTANLMIEADADVVPFTSKAGKPGFNIRSYAPCVAQSPPIQQPQSEVGNTATLKPVVSPPASGIPPQSIRDERSDSIVSQVFIKCATRLLCPRITERTTIKEMNDMAANTIRLVHEMYENGLGLLAHGE